MVRKETSIICDLCGERLSRMKEWIALNRYVVNGGPGHLMITSGEGPDYVWDPHDNRFSGRSLCWPHCAMRWIDGEIIAARAAAKKTG